MCLGNFIKMVAMFVQNTSKKKLPYHKHVVAWRMTKT